MITSRNGLRILLTTKHVRRPVSERVVGFLKATLSNLMLWLFPPAPKQSMCKYYGHVIDRNWKGEYPSCNDCGCLVKSHKDLRKAAVRQPDCHGAI